MDARIIVVLHIVILPCTAHCKNVDSATPPVPQLGYVYNRSVACAKNIGDFYRKMKFHAKEKNIKAYF